MRSVLDGYLMGRCHIHKGDLDECQLDTGLPLRSVLDGYLIKNLLGLWTRGQVE